MLIGDILLFFTAPSQNLVNPKSEQELSANRRKLLRWILVYNLVVLALMIFELNSDLTFTISIIFVVVYAIVTISILSSFNSIKIKLSRRNHLAK